MTNDLESDIETLKRLVEYNDNMTELIEAIENNSNNLLLSLQQEIDQLKADKMRLIIDKAKMTLEIEGLKGEKWRTDKKPLDKFIIVGLWVTNNKTDETYFSQNILCRDSESQATRDIEWEYFEPWEWDDYTHWQPLPEAPEGEL